MLYAQKDNLIPKKYNQSDNKKKTKIDPNIMNKRKSFFRRLTKKAFIA